jgi:hypothetical protein
MRRVSCTAIVVATSLLGTAGSAFAWTVEDPIHVDCHERLSAEVLKQVGYVRPPPALSKEDELLRKSLQFDATKYEANIYALSLILGARWPDAQGAPDFDFYQLSQVHNALDDQGAHCLRGEKQDGIEGDRAALADCRMEIERQFWLALKSMDQHGSVNPDEREPIAEFLPFTGRSLIPVSGFYVHAGIALHAIEDSFTHTYRSPEDGKKIRTFFNWSEQVRGTLEETRDGHGHETALDQCDRTDTGALAAKRVEWSQAAGVEFLRALTEPADLNARQAKLEAFFNHWMSLDEGQTCTLDNDYCGHPTQQWLKGEGKAMSDNYKDGGCSQVSASWPALVLLLFAAFGLRRRRAMLLAVPLLVAFASTDARADEEKPAKKWHVEARASMSVQNPAYALGVWGSWQFKRAQVGAFAELNPWYSVEKRQQVLGSTNVGVFAHYLHPIRPDFHYRLGLALGPSILNQELYGTNAGNMGIYMNLRLLGFVWQLSEGAALTVDGFDLALPAPQLTGWPVLYAQHRVSVGLQF